MKKITRALAGAMAAVLMLSLYGCGKPKYERPDLEEPIVQTEMTYTFSSQPSLHLHLLGTHCVSSSLLRLGEQQENYSASLAEEQATQFLKLTGKVASKYPNLYILMEALNNTVCNFCNTQESSLHLVQMVSMPNVQMEVDFFHMLMMNEPFESFSAYVDRTKHIHISGKSPDGVRRFFVPEEQSLCQSMISAIAKTTYQGTISVEAPLNTFTDESAFRSLQIMQKAALGE